MLLTERKHDDSKNYMDSRRQILVDVQVASNNTLMLQSCSRMCPRADAFLRTGCKLDATAYEGGTTHEAAY